MWEKVHLCNCSILIMQPHKLYTWGSIAERQLSETNHYAKHHHVKRIGIIKDNGKTRIQQAFKEAERSCQHSCLQNNRFEITN